MYTVHMKQSKGLTGWARGQVRLTTVGDVCRYEEDSQRLRQELQQRPATPPPNTGEISSLREQCANHTKERAALKTILESKIRTLVDGIGYSMKELPTEAQQHPRLGREVSIENIGGDLTA